MSRPLRIEFPGAIYHVTARGDRREDIFVDDDDRLTFLSIIAQAMERFEAQVLSYCLMGNHYHFVLHTRQANLSRLMRHVNGVYTQAFNRRHDKVGHLLQGRFKAVLVDRDAYLLEVCRYVELNPVRSGMVQSPSQWVWSSYRAHVGEVGTPAWLDTTGLHGYVLGRTPRTATDTRRAGASYAALVNAGRNAQLWTEGLRQQIYLGDENFVTRMQALIEPRRRDAAEVPRAQRRARTAHVEIPSGPSRDQALWRAYVTEGRTMTWLAEQTGLSVSRISRIIANQQSINSAERMSVAKRAKRKT